MGTRDQKDTFGITLWLALTLVFIAGSLLMGWKADHPPRVEPFADLMDAGEGVVSFAAPLNVDYLTHPPIVITIRAMGYVEDEKFPTAVQCKELRYYRSLYEDAGWYTPANCQPIW